MTAWAEHQFILSQRGKDGYTYRETLEGLLSRSRGGKRADLEAELAGPPRPDAGMYLWHLFLELNHARPSGGMGPGAITFSELDAWSRLTGRALAPWEIQAIRDLDTLYLRTFARPDDGE